MIVCSNTGSFICLFSQQYEFTASSAYESSHYTVIAMAYMPVIIAIFFDIRPCIRR